MQVPQDEHGLVLECGCGSSYWYVRDEITVSVAAAKGALSVTRSGGNHRPVPTTVEAVTRCTSCDGTLQEAVAQL